MHLPSSHTTPISVSQSARTLSRRGNDYNKICFKWRVYDLAFPGRFDATLTNGPRGGKCICGFGCKFAVGQRMDPRLTAHDYALGRALHVAEYSN